MAKKNNDTSYFLIGFLGSIILMIIMGGQIDDNAFIGWNIGDWISYIITLSITASMAGVITLLFLGEINEKR